MTDVRTTGEVAVPSPRPRPGEVEQEDDVHQDDQALIGHPGVRYAVAHCTALRPPAGPRPAGGTIPSPRS